MNHNQPLSSLHWILHLIQACIPSPGVLVPLQMAPFHHLKFHIVTTTSSINMYIFTSFCLKGLNFNPDLHMAPQPLQKCISQDCLWCFGYNILNSLLKPFCSYQYEWQDNALSKTSTNCSFERKFPKHLSSSYLAPFFSPGCCLKYHWIISAKNPSTVGKQTHYESNIL